MSIFITKIVYFKTKSNEAKKSGHQYDFPLSPPPVTSSPTNLNAELNSNLYSPLQSPLITVKLEERIRRGSEGGGGMAQYDLLPRTPQISVNETSANNNEHYSCLNHQPIYTRFNFPPGTSTASTS